MDNEESKRTKIHELILGILTVAVVVLYVLHFTGNKPAKPAVSANEDVLAELTDSTIAEEPVVEEEETEEPVVDMATDTAPAKYDIAYVNVDTLLTKYELAKEMNAQLLKKQKAAQAQLEAKSNQLRTDYTNVQQKYQRGLLSETEAQAEGEKLNKQQQELQQLDNKLTKQMLDEQQKMNKQLLDKIQKFFKEYNKTKHYKAIFSNTAKDNILYAEQGLNITSDVISKLNSEYKKKKK